MVQKLYEEENIRAIADAIRGKFGTEQTYKVSEMAEAVEDITVAEDCTGMHVPESGLKLTGQQQYTFYNGNWSWVIEEFGDKITTDSLSSCSYMFSYCNTDIPFTVNLTTNSLNASVSCDCNNVFAFCRNRTQIPYFTGRVRTMPSFFKSCERLREIPDDWADSLDFSYTQSYVYSSMNGIFESCYSLRKIPEGLLSQLWGVQTSPNYAYTYNGFSSCYALDELNNMPLQQATVTSNVFNNTFSSCSRLKNITFETSESANWKSQTLDLSSYVGYAKSATNITNYNSGLTTETQITDAETYAQLADSEDSWTTLLEYSRFNKTSAENLIASLPDTSAYLATQTSGTNTVKFKSGSGASTTAGSVDSISEETVAQAAAKGWTISFVS